MMHKTSRSGFTVFCLLALGMTVLIYLQSYFLYTLPSVFKHIDFVTIFLLFIFFSNTTFISMLLALFTGSLVDSLSTIKPGFFTLYYLCVLILVKLAENFFYRESFVYKLNVFVFIFFLKFIFIYGLIDDTNISVVTFISEHYLQFLLSTVVFMGLNIIINMTGSVFKESSISQKIH